MSVGLPGMYPTAPIVPAFSQLPSMNPQTWRMLQFGPYLFPVTFQERSRDSKLALIKKKMPFTPGDFNPGNTSMNGRTTEFFGSIAPGMQGFSGNLLRTQDDVENERSYLAGLQALGKQSLYARSDRFMWAWMEDFSITQNDGTGFRMWDWVVKFYADDPRYYGSNSAASNNPGSNPNIITSSGLPNMNSVTYTGGTGPGSNSHNFGHNGNAQAFPIFVLTCTNDRLAVPHFAVAPQSSGGGIGISFSKFGDPSQPGNLNWFNGPHTGPNSKSGDQLVVMCDPRPEYAFICATYYPGYGWADTPSGYAPSAWPTPNAAATNAMAYVAPSDFSNAVNFQYFLPYVTSSSVPDPTGLNSLIIGMGPNTPNDATFQVQVLYWDTYI